VSSNHGRMHGPTSAARPVRTGQPFSQNHTKELVSLDFFVVPTITFELPFMLVILSHDRCIRSNPSMQTAG